MTMGKRTPIETMLFLDFFGDTYDESFIFHILFYSLLFFCGSRLIASLSVEKYLTCQEAGGRGIRMQEK